MASLKDTCGPIKIGEKLRDSKIGDRLCLTALQGKTDRGSSNQLILGSAGTLATSPITSVYTTLHIQMTMAIMIITDLHSASLDQNKEIMELSFKVSAE